MTIPKTIEGREYTKFMPSEKRPLEPGASAVEVIVGNADGIPVYITDPPPGEEIGPSELKLNSGTTETIEDDGVQGTEIGVLTVLNGLAPLVFTIDQDLSNAFQIDGDRLELSRVVDAATEPSLNVSVRCTDDNAKFTTQTFTITVTEAGAFTNNYSYRFHGDGYIVVDNANYTLDANAAWWAWVKYSDPTVQMTVYDSQSGTNGAGVALIIRNIGRIKLSVIDSAGDEKDYRYILPSDYNYNGWHLYTIAIQNNEIKFFVDGTEQTPHTKLKDEDTGNVNSDGTIARLGSNSDATTDFYVGLMAEIGLVRSTLSAAQVATLYNNGFSGDYVELVGGSKIQQWYRADLDTLPIIEDQKGTTDGSSVNLTLYKSAPSPYNNNYSVDFDGLTNYFTGTGVPDFSLAKTFSYWIKRTTTGGQTLYHGPDTTKDTFKIFYNANGNVHFTFEDVSDQSFRARFVVPNTLGVWQHIVITNPPGNLDPTLVKCYADTVEYTPGALLSNATAIPLPSNILTIGADTGGGSKLDAIVTEFTIWDRELTELEVVELYNSGAPNSPERLSFGEDLFQHWRFGDVNQQGATMEDQTLRGAALTMTGYDSDFYVTDTP